MSTVPPLRRTRLGARLSLTDGCFVIVRISRLGLTLRSASTGECRIVSISDLPMQLANPGVHPLEGMKRIRELDSVDGPELEKITMREAHILEVLYGTPLPGKSPRPEYAPTESQAARLARKSKELDDAGISPHSVRHLKRLISAYRQIGPAGLRDGRMTHEEKPFSRADHRIIDAMVEVADRLVNESTQTRVNVRKRVSKLLLEWYPDEEIQLPSKNTLESYWKQVTHGKYTFGNAQNRRTARNVPDRMFAPRRALAPGDEVQIDSSPFDIYVKGPNGKSIKAVLTIMIDKATRSIIAASVMPRGVKGADHTLLLARCLVPRQLRPMGPLDALDVVTLPWAARLTEAEADRCACAMPYIVPVNITTDNGADFRSAAFRSAAEFFGFNLVRASVRTPTDKAIVERAFKTIKDNFAALLPGFTGGSVDRRGSAPESDGGLLDLFTLQALFDRWIAIVYQNTVTEGLRDVYDPSIELSPNAAYLAVFDFTGGIPVPLTADDYISLLPVKSQCILRDGITINYRRYDSEALNPFREMYDPRTRKSRRWEIRWDPYDPQTVWIEHPDTHEWVACPWMNQSTLTEPFNAEIRAAARKIRTAAPGMTHDEGRVLAEQLVEHSKRTQRAKDQLEAGRKLREAAGVPIPKRQSQHRRPPVIEEPPVSLDYVDPFGRFDPWGDQ